MTCYSRCSWLISVLILWVQLTHSTIFRGASGFAQLRPSHSEPLKGGWVAGRMERAKFGVSIEEHLGLLRFLQNLDFCEENWKLQFHWKICPSLQQNQVNCQGDWLLSRISYFIVPITAPRGNGGIAPFPHLVLHVMLSWSTPILLVLQNQ